MSCTVLKPSTYWCLQTSCSLTYHPMLWCATRFSGAVSPPLRASHSNWTSRLKHSSLLRSFPHTSFLRPAEFSLNRSQAGLARCWLRRARSVSSSGLGSELDFIAKDLQEALCNIWWLLGLCFKFICLFAGTRTEDSLFEKPDVNHVRTIFNTNSPLGLASFNPDLFTYFFCRFASSPGKQGGF